MINIKSRKAAGLTALVFLAGAFFNGASAADAAVTDISMNLSECIKLTSLEKECHAAYEQDSGDAWARIANNFILRYDAGNQVNGEMFSYIVYSFEKAAQRGNPQGLFYMSQLYRVGTDRSIVQDRDKALAYLEDAVKKDYPRALALKGFFQHQGLGGVYLNSREGLELVREAAEKGDAFSENLMGLITYNGAGVDRDPERAFRWFEKSASHGYAAAYNNLGFLYENGVGAEKNPEMAFRFYEKAAKKDLREGLLNLGRAYLYGIGVKSDYVKAFPYFERAADRNLNDAMYLAGWMLHSGYGVTADLPRGFHYLDKASEVGNVPATALLADMYEKGEGVACQPEKAKELRDSIIETSWHPYNDATMVPAALSLPEDFMF